MHELSLASGLIEQLLSLAAEHKAERILRLTVTIGPFSGIVIDSFTFGFDALKLEQPVTNAAILEIESPLPSYRCIECEHTFVLEQDEQNLNFGLPYGGAPGNCAACGSSLVFPAGGDELILKQVEME